MTPWWVQWHFKITGVSIVYSTFCSGADQRKHQSSASLAFVRGIHQWLVNSPHKGPVTRKMFPFDDVIIWAIINPSACITVKISSGNIHFGEKILPRSVIDGCTCTDKMIWNLHVWSIPDTSFTIFLIRHASYKMEIILYKFSGEVFLSEIILKKKQISWCMITVLHSDQIWTVSYKTKFGSQNFGYQIWWLFV